MLKRKLLFTSLALLLVLGSAPDLGANSRWRPIEPNPLDAPLAGMRVGSEIKLSPDPDPPVAADRYEPAVAYNYLHDEYLVVWTNVWPGGNSDIYARRVSRTGEILSWFCITTGTESRSWPAVAYNATNDEYLVVWAYEASTLVYDIWGKIIPWNAPGTNPEFQIIPHPAYRSFWAPRVAWNSNRNEYLVVWNAVDTNTDFPPGRHNKIGGHRLSASGTIYNPTSPIIIDSADLPQQADLAYNAATDEYLVVWVRYYTATGYDIYGARVSGEGAVVSPPAQFVIMGTNDDEYHPAVATNGVDRYLVAWEWVTDGTDHNVRATDLDELGSPVGLIWWSATVYSETNPDVAFTPGAQQEYALVWQQSSTSGDQIWAFRHTATTSTGWFALASRANWQSHSPAVAIGRPGYLIAYASDSLVDPAVDQHIYARLWWPEAAYVPLVLRNQ